MTPRAWGATPVLFYGFDDLSVLQRDTVLALAATDAEVVVSLAYEPGRHAFAARGETFFELEPHARHVVLDAQDRYYAPWSRDALHRLERRLFEGPGDDVAADDGLRGPVRRGLRAAGRCALRRIGGRRPGAAGRRGAHALRRPRRPVGPRRPRLREAAAASEGLFARTATPEDPVAPARRAGDGITLLEGGGERAEMELVAAEVARLIDEEGVPAEEIAVVLRRPDDAASLVAQVFAAFGIPVALDQRTTLGHTPLGRGLIALLRAATGGTSDDVLAWLRTPGLVEDLAPVDRLEADVRRLGARSAAEARRLWQRRVPDHPLEALDRVADAQARGPHLLLERLADELSLLFAAPHRREAPVFDGAETAEARVLAAGRRALGELGGLAEADPALVPAPPELAALLAGVEVRLGERSAAGAVQVADPLTLRARRVRALFACRLQEGAFPAPARPSRSSTTASGARSTPRPACGCARTRTPWARSATSSTRRSAGPRRGST
jgi:hypothetical protein